MYEHKQSPLLPRRAFFSRMARHFLIGFGVLAACVAAGMVGYHWFEHFGWVDSFANASMILSGMGPLDPVRSVAGRLFVGVYSLFSGVVFLTTIGFFLMPVIHRLLHTFHVKSDGREGSGEGG